MSPFDIFSFSLGGAIIVIMLFGIMVSVFAPSLDKWSKRYFIWLFTLLFLCAVVCFLGLIFWYDPTKAKVEKVVYFFESLLLSVPIFMPTIFLLHATGEPIKNNPLFLSIMAFLSVYSFMLILTLFTDVFYYVTADNKYVRGPLYALTIAPMLCILVFNVAYAVKRRKALSKKYFVGLMIYLLPMSMTLVVHMFVSIELLVAFGMAIFALIMFALIISDNMEQNARQQREIAKQRANIMVLQMRPHFIYNSLMGIYYLCDQDAAKAKQVTLDFTTYLRKNFAAIASEDTIPFSEELKHTKAYLAIEQAQFEDSLFVSFSVPHTSFRLPPLTLQPIVENAVVHGLRGSNAPIHISVVTRMTDWVSEIIVEDDGPGFQNSADDHPHIALGNIRERLRLMCNGSLTVSPREGGGTIVKVTIPLDRS